MSSKFSFPLVVVTILTVLICASDLCWSDTFRLKNGNRLEGIIIKETPNSFTVRVKSGTVGILKESVEHIERATLDENKALQQKWEEEEGKREEDRKLAILKENEEKWKLEEKERKEKEEKVFYEEVLGWKKYQDEWMPAKLADLFTLKDNLSEEEQNFDKEITKHSEERERLKSERRIIRNNQKKIEEEDNELEYEKTKMRSKHALDRYDRKVFAHNKEIIKNNDRFRRYNDAVDNYNKECQELIGIDEFLSKAWVEFNNLVNIYFKEEIYEDIFRAYNIQRFIEEREKREQERKKKLKGMEI